MHSEETVNTIESEFSNENTQEKMHPPKVRLTPPGLCVFERFSKKCNKNSFETSIYVQTVTVTRGMRN